MRVAIALMKYNFNPQARGVPLSFPYEMALFITLIPQQPVDIRVYCKKR